MILYINRKSMFRREKNKKDKKEIIAETDKETEKGNDPRILNTK